MPHWHIPTQHVDANEGGTFWENACNVESSNTTETQKKVTCRDCKAILAHPRTAAQAAARLYQRVTLIQDSTESQTFSHVEVACNACGRQEDCSEWRYDHPHDVLRRIMTFMEHVGFDHMGGSEVEVKVVTDELSAYELNFALQKQPMTMHEEAWRARHELPVVRVGE